MEDIWTLEGILAEAMTSGRRCTHDRERILYDDLHAGFSRPVSAALPRTALERLETADPAVESPAVDALILDMTKWRPKKSHGSHTTTVMASNICCIISIRTTATARGG